MMGSSVPDAPLRETLRRYYVFLRPYRFRAVLTIVMTILAGWTESVIPLLLKPFADSMIRSERTEVIPYLSYIPILIIVFSLAQSGFKFAGNYLGTWVGRRIANDLKARLFEKLMRNEAAFFDQSTSGTVLLRFNSDADSASDGVIGNINMICQRLFISVGLIVVLIYLSRILALVAIVALVLAVLPLVTIRRHIRKIIHEGVQVGASISTSYYEAFSGSRTVMAYNLYDQQNEKLAATLARVFRLSVKMVQRVGFMSLFMHLAIAIGLAATVWLQSYLIRHNLITFGDFVAFIAALMMLYTPIKALGNNFTAVQSSFQAIVRVMETLDRQPAIVNRPDAKVLSGVRRAIRYDGVGFAYESDRPVLKNVNLEIHPGQTVAFVGSSGGGKTTLVNLLPRFYDVTAGSVSIDGTDVRDLDLDSLRSRIAVVFQDNFLFGGSIRENILLGKQDASAGELDRAVRAACLDEFIASLESGLDTIVGERGVMLSGGQKQRVAIARAFIKDAPMIILDEATSALDNQSEGVVQQAIENLMCNKTVLVVAHRLSTVINADHIVVLQDGEIVESGRHQELFARPDGVYASLYRTQLA
ncbi:MAG: ABC transporter ATP-binding protein/permease [Planctomycetes bacterium]|nr:ABC transporter ATP-binding protein/permease [Planctomycetota bacterium]